MKTYQMNIVKFPKDEKPIITMIVGDKIREYVFTGKIFAPMGYDKMFIEIIATGNEEAVQSDGYGNTKRN